MSTLLKRSLLALAGGSVLIGSLALAAVPAFAAGPGPAAFPRPAVVGKVTAISGNTVTVSSLSWGRDDDSKTAQSTTTYSVDASGATVSTNGKASSLSNITVGDLVMVEGTVTGTSVTATAIRDGMMFKGVGPKGPRGPQDEWMEHSSSTRIHASSTPPFAGNGEPVIGGTVSGVSGSTFTVTAKAGQTYSVDASSAKFTKPGVSGATIANVSNGDSVVVQGAVNGSSVTASTVIDQAVAASGGAHPPHRGVLGAIGGFFTRVFGFF